MYGWSKVLVFALLIKVPQHSSTGISTMISVAEPWSARQKQALYFTRTYTSTLTVCAKNSYYKYERTSNFLYGFLFTKAGARLVFHLHLFPAQSDICVQLAWVDKMLKEYSCHRISRRWPFVLLTHVINVCTLNSYILFKKRFSESKMTKCTFLKELGSALVRPQVQKRAAPPRSRLSYSVQVALQAGCVRWASASWEITGC